MKLNAETQEVESEGFTSTGFSLEVDDPQIIEILTQKIYTDPFIFPRELMANAIDSGGIYELVMPDALNPQWEVEDKGDGMTHHFMMTNYSKIFHSTKRKDNNNIGGFGHGRLSPLAYTDSYSVRSRFKGADGTIMEGNYVVYRGPNKIPMITCASMARSDVQETGVRVSVPIANTDLSKIAEKSQFFAQYLKPTPPGVKAVKYVFEQAGAGAVRSTDDVNNGYGRPTNNEHIPGIRLVIGGVPYPAPSNVSGASNLALDLFFNIGELDVTLSRDAVNNTTAANDLIAKRYKAVIDAYNAHIKAEIEAKPTLFERYETWYTLYNKAGSSFRNTFLRGIEVAHKLPIKEVLDAAKQDFAIHMLTSDVDRNQWDGMDNVTKSYRSLTGLRIFMLNDRCDIERRDGRTSTTDIDFRNILTRYGTQGNILDNLTIFAVPMPYTTGQIKKIKDYMSSVLGAARDKTPSKLINIMLIQYKDKADVQNIVGKIVSNAKVNFIDTGAVNAKLARYIPLSFLEANNNWQPKKKAFTDKAMGLMGADTLYFVNDVNKMSERSANDALYTIAHGFPELVEGKTILILKPGDEKFLDTSKVLEFKAEFLKHVASDYGYEYTSGLFDANDVRNAEFRRENAYTLLTHKVKGSGSGVNKTLAEKLSTEKDLIAAKPQLITIFKEVVKLHANATQTNTNSGLQKYRRMLETIISLRDRYKFITAAELPAATKTLTQPQATIQKDDLAALLVSHKLLEHLAQDYNVRYYGYDATTYKAIVEYLTKV